MQRPSQTNATREDSSEDGTKIRATQTTINVDGHNMLSNPFSSSPIQRDQASGDESQAHQIRTWQEFSPASNHLNQQLSYDQQKELPTLADVPSDVLYSLRSRLRTNCYQSYSKQLRIGDPDKTVQTPGSKRKDEVPAFPPVAAGLALLEIYFSRIYNATLIFSKPIFVQQYIEGEVPGYLLRAIFATASL